MIKKTCFITSLIFFFLSSLANADIKPPSNDEIQNWWKQKSQEQLKIEGEPLQIHLRNKEIAYIVPVGFYDRGRNFIWHSVLVRTALKEVREIEGPIGEKCVVINLNVVSIDEVSVIETESIGSGQGTTIGIKSIVQIDGWNPIVLHQAKFEEGQGNCYNYKNNNDVELCSNSKQVLWQYTDLDFDGAKDLVEVIIISDNDNPKKECKIKKTLNLYLFKNNKFIKIKDTIKAK